AEYWKTVQAHGSRDLDQRQIEFACQKLLEAERPEETFKLLSGVPHGKASVSPPIAMNALEAYAKWRLSHPDAQLRGDLLHIIRGLFGWLQKAIQSDNDELTQRLGQLEWEYLSLLEGSQASPRTLIHCLSESPEFFARLITLVFPSATEQELMAEPSEAERQRASHAYRLLLHWKRIPGTQSDNSIDEEQLFQWLESARSLCRELGRLEAADSAIGEMLASWPQHDDDARWPCEVVCDAIEEMNSDDLDRGFQVGVLNLRGVTMKSPFDGGDLERREATKYRRWAEQCDLDWPRTAASLRNVAESYASDARREDARAAEWAQERH
ncbi:MAG: hypothetical protein U1E05_10800, partial [Patescibacteria group bacterium]|nr:hypothetical protein [Patescibacteria group bacterium]